MRAVIQRVKQASVIVNQKTVGSINHGLLIFVGVTHNDTIEDIVYLTKKIANMRIFEDENDKMNLSILQKKYDILSISQFTLYANTKKGNRPSFTDSSKPEHAKQIYDIFNQELMKYNINLQTGIFGEMMDVSLINDGPVTIMIDSKQTL